MKKVLKELFSYIIIIVVVIIIRTFIVTPVRVDGDSMVDTLHNNEILLLNKLDKSYDRFDIVVIKYGKSKLVKRIIGLPGETIEYKDNKLLINGDIIDDVALARTSDFDLDNLYDLDEIPSDYYFVMGDNRRYSLDSRDSRVGLIKKEDIIGTTSIRLFPFNKIGKFN